MELAEREVLAVVLAPLSLGSVRRLAGKITDGARTVCQRHRV